MENDDITCLGATLGERRDVGVCDVCESARRVSAACRGLNGT